jgi:hypothetical protein
VALSRSKWHSIVFGIISFKKKITSTQLYRVDIKGIPTYQEHTSISLKLYISFLLSFLDENSKRSNNSNIANLHISKSPQ